VKLVFGWDDRLPHQNDHYDPIGSIESSMIEANFSGKWNGAYAGASGATTLAAFLPKCQ
jgi:hypothetical protein